MLFRFSPTTAENNCTYADVQGPTLMVHDDAIVSLSDYYMVAVIQPIRTVLSHLSPNDSVL